MDIEEMTLEQKDIFYGGFKDQEELMEGYPYLRIPCKDAFLGEINPIKKVSLLKRLYHTFFN